MCKCCFDCRFFENDKCKHDSGLLKDVKLSESMALAEHDCEYYLPITYKVTAAGVLSKVLSNYGIEVPIDQIKAICDDYFKDLIQLGILCSD